MAVVIGAQDMRRALYESVAESVPPLHGELLMALERAVRFNKALGRKDKLGQRARAALPVVRDLAEGRKTMQDATAVAQRLGFDPNTLRDAAAAIRIARDPSDVARAVCAVAAQIERGPDVEVHVGGFLDKVKKGFSKVATTAHNITHKGPIKAVETKVQDAVTKALPITKPFVNFHKNVSSKLTTKVLTKTGVIKDGASSSSAKPAAAAAVRVVTIPKPSGKVVPTTPPPPALRPSPTVPTPIGKAPAGTPVNYMAALPAPNYVTSLSPAVTAAKPLPQVSRGLAAPPGASSTASKVASTQVRAKSGNVYNVTVTRA